MTRWMLTVAVAVCLVGVSGCARMHKTLFPKQARQIETLQSQVTSLEAERDLLKAQNRDLKAEVATRAAKGDALSEEAKRLQKLLAEYQEKIEKRERDWLELKTLLEEIGLDSESREEGNFIIMPNDVLFASGRIELSDEAKFALNEVAGYLLGHDDLSIRVDGHTDGVPIRASTWKDNYHLAALRAHSVMVYLMERGVAPDRMFIAGFGANRPMVEPGSPEDPVDENRRVEILILHDSILSKTEIIEGFLE